MTLLSWLCPRTRDARASARATPEARDPQTRSRQTPYRYRPSHRYDPFTGLGAAPPRASGMYYVHNLDHEIQLVAETRDIRHSIEERLRTGDIHPGDNIVYILAAEPLGETRREA